MNKNKLHTMKLHLYLAAASASLLILAGCESGVTQISETGKPVSVPVWFESLGGPSTKVDIDGDSGAGTWTEGDQVAIYVTGEGADFYQIKTIENIEAGNENTGHVMVSLASGQNRANYAIYPASAAVDGHVTANDLYVNYPSEYDFSGLTVSQMETYSPVPMVAVNEPVSGGPDTPAPALYFYHVGGVLRIKVPGVPQSAYALRITFPEGSKLTGTFKVTDGGTEDAVLTPEGDDHGTEITVKIPILDTSIQDLVLNIPIPYGDYDLTDRTYIVDVRSEKIAYMRTTGIINFSKVLRAQGKKQTLPTVETLGTMAGLYLTRGYLFREPATTVLPENMSISAPDQLMFLDYYNKAANSIGKKLYINFSDLGKIMTGNSSFASASFEDAVLEIDGEYYKAPSQEDWVRIISGSRPGSVVNGQRSVRFSRIKVNLDGSNYSQSTISGVLLYPDGGVFDCPSITNYNTANATAVQISYGEFRKLTDAPNACVFIGATGHTGGTNWFNLNNTGGQPTSTYSTSAPFYLKIAPEVTDATTNTGYQPVRLAKIEKAD